MKKLGGIVALLLGLAALAFAARTALTSTASRDRAADITGSSVAGSAPKRQLDNVRSRAKEIEREAKERADEVARKAAAE